MRFFSSEGFSKRWRFLTSEMMPFFSQDLVKRLRALLFAGLGETLESAFKRFVGLNNYADHDYPLVKLEIRFWIAKYI